MQVKFFSSGYHNFQCITLASGDKSRRMLWVFQRFDKHCSCHLQSKWVTMGFRTHCTGQAVGGEWDVMDLICRTEMQAVIQLAVSR